MNEDDGKSKRPYRLWHEQNKKYVPWAYYKVLENARWGALRACKWCKVGETITVQNKDNANELGQYTRRIDGVKIDNDASWKVKS